VIPSFNNLGGYQLDCFTFLHSMKCQKLLMHRSCAANSEHSVECLTPDSLDHFELETFLNPVPQMCGIYSPWTDNWQIWNCHYSYHNA